jgi:nicotinamide riboside kinase
MAAPIRIALAGPEATGKTTLAQALASSLGHEVLSDPRPDVLRASGCHTLFEADRLQPVWRQLLERQIEREATLSGPAVLDTCALDYWVLWQRWSWCATSPAEVEDLFQQTLQASSRYGLVLQMPSTQVSAPAGHRFIHPAYAAQISRLLVSVVSELTPAIPIVPVPAAAREVQLELTLARVKELTIS